MWQSTAPAGNLNDGTSVPLDHVSSALDCKEIIDMAAAVPAACKKARRLNGRMLMPSPACERAALRHCGSA
jgi:hypothetical protein